MKGLQKRTCLDMLYHDYNSYEHVPIYNLDIMFYLKGDFVYLIKAYNCPAHYTCWNYGVAVLSSSNLYLYLTRNKQCDDYDQYYSFNNIFVQLTVYDKHFTVQQTVQDTLNLVTSKNISIFTFSCQKLNCLQLKESIFKFEMHDSYFVEQFYIFNLEQTNGSYKYGFWTGIGVLLIVIIVFVLKCVQTIRNINLLQIVDKIKRLKQIKED
ncbi:Hypothetical_protein [Hexamita inflata]|uniref:Hypothetical_protein n=1 Tax=Hexamita inflata TaxID=28002 RepID=A0ABP1HIT8_9EUKA